MKYKKQYRNLETKVFCSLRDLIQEEGKPSKKVNEKSIKVEIDNFKEITILSDGLVLLDENGYCYSIFSIGLENLIDILEKNIA